MNLLQGSTLFALAVITSFSLALAAVSYKYSTERADFLRQTSPTRISKNLEIIAVDPVAKTATARVLGGEGGSIDLNLQNAVIERREPILENGIMVGLSSLDRKTIEDLSPGQRVFTRIRISPDGTFQATYVLLDDPLAEDDHSL
ncbi:hypothetical protein HY417_03460 [Candidatus Kaiserbacteria bacterium]|nr:hypothetical protein [Candidatus Kaiserbacteria bacterium]